MLSPMLLVSIRLLLATGGRVKWQNLDQLPPVLKLLILVSLPVM